MIATKKSRVTIINLIENRWMKSTANSNKDTVITIKPLELSSLATIPSFSKIFSSLSANPKRHIQVYNPLTASVLLAFPRQNRSSKAIFSFSCLSSFFCSCFFAMLALQILWRLRGFRFTVLWKLLVFKLHGSRRRVQKRILLLHGSWDSQGCLLLWYPFCLPKTCHGKLQNS